MTSNPQTPDYELEDTIELTTAEQVKALSDPLRTSILQLLHERAATVTELAAAVKRPKSTIAHHVNVLAAAGLLKVVRTRRVRAIEERFYGRAARVFFYEMGRTGTLDFNDFEVAAKESVTAFEAGRLRSQIRHARVPDERVGEFWERVHELVQEFDKLPRSGDTTYGFVVGAYPVNDYPALPPRDDDAS